MKTKMLSDNKAATKAKTVATSQGSTHYVASSKTEKATVKQSSQRQRRTFLIRRHARGRARFPPDKKCYVICFYFCINVSALDSA